MTSVGTLACYYEFDENYKKCSLLNAIQHIDIFGKSRTSYVESRRMDNTAVTSVSSYCKKFVQPVRVSDVNSRLSQFSVTTKVSGLYPGNDILSKKSRAKVQRNVRSNFEFSAVVVR